MKIFGIGLSKTGTTSLARALEILGYRTRDNLGVVDYIQGDLSSINSGILDTNDAFTDTPIPNFYRELDAKYPDSKFILTVRDMEGWLKSCKKQFTQKLSDKQNAAHTQLFMDLYDSTVFDEEKFRTGYEDFVDGVYQYFADRPQDLLTLNVSSGDGWEILCPFLGKPVPDVLFPKANVTRIRWMNIDDINRIAQQAGREAKGIYEFMQGDRFSLGASKAAALQKLGYYLQKARHPLRKNSARSLETAVEASLRTICSGLKGLNPQIPVISPQRFNNVPYSEQKKWNHFWLVDPLDGNSLSHNPETTLTVSISLIEDRIPIIGVVYAPAIDTTYYAMAGKGAFRIKGGGDPVKLLSQAENERGQSTGQNLPHSLGETRQQTGLAPPYNALTLCLLAEGKHVIKSSLENTMEWHTAAAQAVVNATGMKLTNCDTGEQLTYNKEGFSNDRIVIE
jgi:3'-phosphoadenosine 5'-phosphosulfate (PAPS) 3'-phosphatase